MWVAPTRSEKPSGLSRSPSDDESRIEQPVATATSRFVIETSYDGCETSAHTEPRSSSSASAPAATNASTLDHGESTAFGPPPIDPDDMATYPGRWSRAAGSVTACARMGVPSMRTSGRSMSSTARRRSAATGSRKQSEKSPTTAAVSITRASVDNGSTAATIACSRPAAARTASAVSAAAASRSLPVSDDRRSVTVSSFLDRDRVERTRSASGFTRRA